MDNETIRNLRNLVKELIEQYKYYAGVKEENEELRKTMSEQSQLLGSQLDDLTYQRNILQVSAVLHIPTCVTDRILIVDSKAAKVTIA